MIRATLRGLLSRKLRLVLSALSVVLGVMFVSGAFVLTDTLSRSFDQLFSSDYNLITGTIAPSKPMIIGEFGSSEYGGSKAAWIQDALSRIPVYTKIRGAQYFEKYDDGMDWPIETSTTATAAFAAGIQNPAYLTNSYAGLSTTGVQPPG